MFPFEQRLKDDEKKKLLNRHASLDFAYLILYVKAEFDKRGYSVSQDYQDIRFLFDNGKRIDYDLCLKKDMKKILVDIENGKLYREDYYNRLDKMAAVSKDIYLIAKDEMQLYSYTKPNCFFWLRDRFDGIENAKGKINLHFGTLEWLIVNEKIWETVEI